MASPDGLPRLKGVPSCLVANLASTSTNLGSYLVLALSSLPELFCPAPLSFACHCLI